MKGGVRAHAREASFREGSKVGKLRSEEEEEEGGGRGSRWQQVARWPGTNVPDLLHLPTGVVDDVVCPGNDVPPVPFRNKPSVVTVPVYGVNGQGILAVMGQGVSIILRPGPSLSLFLYRSRLSPSPILSYPPPPFRFFFFSSFQLVVPSSRDFFSLRKFSLSRSVDTLLENGERNIEIIITGEGARFNLWRTDWEKRCTIDGQTADLSGRKLGGRIIIACIFDCKL